MRLLYLKTLSLLAVSIIVVGSVWSDANITIHAYKTGEPISKYIYGQFIEHLGRCIYGGIWAEMLEDRKFFYPITDEYQPWRTETDRGFFRGGEYQVLVHSPWKVIGGDGTIEMITRNAFAGEHTPEITVKGAHAGIEQSDLGVKKGHDYVGYVYLSGDTRVGAVEVTLQWGEGESDKATHTIEKISRDFKKYDFHFTAQADTDEAVLRITASGKGKYKIGTVSIMPANNINGFRPDTLQLLRELNSPVYRWPGGNFVSDYNWKDGIGDRDKRPPRKNPAWTGIEHNDVGIHEFMDLCRLIHTEPFIAVNTGLGSVELAAEEVEYCNGSVDTPMGKWRAENGHPEPYNVKWWAVGNEMYGDWQKGHMPLEDYVKKHNACADLMYSKDPTIQLIGVGSVGDWSQTMMKICSDHMDLISEHIYRRENRDLAAHVGQLRESIKQVADAHREYRRTIDGLEAKDIRIAMDEWNYWYGQYVYGELGVKYKLQDALGVTAGLHEYYRNSDIFIMANYAQTVNVIGAIKTSKTDAVLDTTGLALKLYRHHFGDVPIEINNVPEPLDIAAAWLTDDDGIAISIVNPSTEFVTVNVDLKGPKFKETGMQWQIAGNDKDAHNAPGETPAVQIETEPVIWNGGKLVVPPISVTLYNFDVKN